MAKAERLEKEADKAMAIGHSAEALSKRREAQRARNAAAKYRVGAQTRTETYAKTKIEPVFRKLRRAEEKNKTLTNEKKNLEAQLKKLEQENQTLKRKFYKPSRTKRGTPIVGKATVESRV